MDKVQCPARRRLFRRALAAAVTLTAVGAARSEESRTKLTRAEAEYQDGPKDIRMCATCTLFLPPKSCKVVEGEVSPNGWCKLFEIAD
jgi:hypothetical protein